VRFKRAALSFLVTTRSPGDREKLQAGASGEVRLDAIQARGTRGRCPKGSGTALGDHMISVMIIYCWPWLKLPTAR